MTVLLELMTHPSMSKTFVLLSTMVSNPSLTAEATRKGAIHTVRRWWPDVQPMATRIKAYTKLCLERLAMPKDERPSADAVESLGRYLPERVTVPVDKTEVTQYLEGSLALSVKDPRFLEPYVLANETG
jgi:symplekin